MFEYSVIGGLAGIMVGLVLVWRYEANYYRSRRKQNSANK